MRAHVERGRYWRNLQEGCPIAISLLLTLGLRYVGATYFGYHPPILSRLLADPTVGVWWEAGMVACVVVLLLLYASGSLTRWPGLTIAILALFTGGNLLRIGDLAVKPLGEPGAGAGTILLAEAATVWSASVLLFTVWYWLLEQGVSLTHPTAPPRPDFLFPQQASEVRGYSVWRPAYLDYLFLAFCTSVAFSPADTLTLSHRAKALQMLQALAAQALLALVVARAINQMSG
jgi:hypothetical protein